MFRNLNFANNGSLDKITDFPGAWNGLQVENNWRSNQIRSSVDAGLVPFRLAIEKKIDLLICHHGLFWTPPYPLTGSNFEEGQTLSWIEPRGLWFPSAPRLPSGNWK